MAASKTACSGPVLRQNVSTTEEPRVLTLAHAMSTP
ncbi:Uncharacterised protein [Mycobacteroides abscessus subsp. abscessus]|nr:Uncharacterised protein [Mycobacteroides abscessus subsp. abscessus]